MTVVARVGPRNEVSLTVFASDSWRQNIKGPGNYARAFECVVSPSGFEPETY